MDSRSGSAPCELLTIANGRDRPEDGEQPCGGVDLIPGSGSATSCTPRLDPNEYRLRLHGSGMDRARPNAAVQMAVVGPTPPSTLGRASSNPRRPSC